MSQKIVATVTIFQQVGQHSFRDCHHSRVFSVSHTFHDILLWAESVTGKKENITGIQLSEYDEESI